MTAARSLVDRENPIKQFWQTVAVERRLPNVASGPLKKHTPLRWKTNTHMVEIEITTACNLGCFNCDRSSGQAVSTERMTVAQIRKFVDESIAQNHKWTRIKILGGEPTLHSDLIAILTELKRYKDTVYSGCVIWVYSNGYGAKVDEVIERLPPWVKIQNTAKESRLQDFSAYNIAPIDLDEYRDSDFTKACDITEGCGVGLTRYGFYLCGAGASVDRVFGLDVGIKCVRDLTRDNLFAQRAILCSRCGHFHTFRAGLQQTSKSWQEAYERYHQRRPELTLY